MTATATTTATPVLTTNTDAGWDAYAHCPVCGECAYERIAGPFAVTMPDADEALCEDCADAASPTPGAWQIANGLNAIVSGIYAADLRHRAGLVALTLDCVLQVVTGDGIGDGGQEQTG